MLDLLKKGERNAFDEIYERYWERLFYYAVKKVGDREEAEDLIQDLFVSVWVKRNDFLINSSLNAYLFAALKHRIINFYKANQVKRKHLDSLRYTLNDLDHSMGNMLIYNETESRLEDGLNKLSPKLKLIFTLSRKENLSLDEISQKTAVPKQSVKNQISKALKILRAHLNHGYFWVVIFLFPPN
ncbi:MAG: RNA polymerase sigma-70 factor [Candidatus Paceibacterota bacterium]